MAVARSALRLLNRPSLRVAPVIATQGAILLHTSARLARPAGKGDQGKPQ